MQDIISLQIGNCGNAVGQQFWETICQEHGIDESGAYVGHDELQKKNIDVYFREIKELTYTPKSVMIDLDRRAIQGVRNSPYGQIFDPDNAIYGVEGAGNNWAKAHFTEGAEVSNNALEVIRKEAESCDCLTEIETVHSVGGGAGAGLGSLILSKLDEEYPNTILTTYSIIPSSNISNCVVEPYNAVLTLNYLIDYTNKSFCMDNDALYSIAENSNLTQADFGGVNSIMSCTMSGITTFTRFPGPSNLSFKKFIVNAVPFPRLHFFVSGLGSTMKKTKAKQEVKLVDFVATAFDYNNYLAACDMKKGVFLTAACVFRGKLSAKEVLKHLDRAKNKNSPNFVEWIPNNFKVSFCDVTPPNWTGPISTFIANTTSVQDIFKRLHTKYRKMLKRKIFLHWFIDEGMDEVDFEEAEENLVTVIEEYKAYEMNSNTPG